MLYSSLTLSGNGSISNSAAVTIGSATLTLNNSGTINTNRLADTAPITMTGGGTLDLQDSTESVGTLVLAAGQSTSEANGALTYGGISRSADGGTINFTGSGSSQITGATNTDGILGAYAFYNGSDWAAVGAQNDIVAYTGYVTDINAAIPTSNVKLTGGGTTTLTALSNSMVINSLNLYNSSSPSTLDLAGKTLTVTSGGILMTSTSSEMTIQDGKLTSANGEIIFTDGQDMDETGGLTVNANIVNSTVPLSVTVSGNGGEEAGKGITESTMYFGGTNTYTGGTYLQGEEMVIESASALPSTTTVYTAFGGTLDIVHGGTIAGLSGSSGGVDISSGTLTINSSSNSVYSGQIEGNGGLTKTGSGKFTYSGAGYHFFGPIMVSGGVLAIAEGQLGPGFGIAAPDNTLGSAPLILAGGTLEFDTATTASPGLPFPVVSGVIQSFASLTLQGNSVLNLANSVQFTLAIADSSADAWTGTLTLEGFNPSIDEVQFGTSASGLTASQLEDITFAGSTDQAELDSNGYLIAVPTPEPGVLSLFGLSAILLSLVGRFVARKA
jgi:hypothetical protein